MAASNRRPGFSRRAQYSVFLGYVIAAAGVAVALVLLVISRFDPVAFSAFRGGLAEVTSPMSSGLAWAGRGIGAVPTAIGDHWRVVDRNRELTHELQRQHALIQRARSLAYDNRRLRMLLRVREGAIAPVVTARLVASSAGSTRRYATLNAGSRQGVRPGQPVTGPEGLVGRTVETSFNTARILLLTDPESIVPVRRTRDGLAAIAVGRGDGLVELKSAAGSTVGFRAGDAFVTSGNGGLFPPGILVARVTANARDTVLGWPFARPDTFDYATVMQVFVDQPPPVPAAPR